MFFGRKLIGVVVITGLAFGAFGVGHAIANNFIDQRDVTVPVFATNENGQTYGSAAECSTLESEPDLIQAEGVDGTRGYVLNKDLNGDMPKTPEEAVAMQKSAPKVKTIPLYAADGKTVIGEFQIGGGKTVCKGINDSTRFSK